MVQPTGSPAGIVLVAMIVLAAIGTSGCRVDDLPPVWPFRLRATPESAVIEVEPGQTVSLAIQALSLESGGVDGLEVVWLLAAPGAAAFKGELWPGVLRAETGRGVAGGIESNGIASVEVELSADATPGTRVTVVAALAVGHHTLGEVASVDSISNTQAEVAADSSIVDDTLANDPSDGASDASDSDVAEDIPSDTETSTHTPHPAAEDTLAPRTWTLVIVSKEGTP